MEFVEVQTTVHFSSNISYVEQDCKYNCISEKILKLSKSTVSEQKELVKDIIDFHQSHNIWMLPPITASSRFFQLYCSIPDRLCLEAMIDVQRFYGKIISDWNSSMPVSAAFHLVDKLIKRGFGHKLLNAMENDYLYAFSLCLHLSYESAVKWILSLLDVYEDIEYIKEFLQIDKTKKVFCAEQCLLSARFEPAQRFIRTIFLYDQELGIDIANFVVERWSYQVTETKSISTLLLLTILGFMNESLLNRDLLIRGIQARLDSTNRNIHLFGVLVAEAFAFIFGEGCSVDFELDPNEVLVQQAKRSFHYGALMDYEEGRVCAEIKPFFPSKDSRSNVNLGDFDNIPVDPSHVPYPTNKEHIIADLLTEREPKNAKNPTPHFLCDAIEYLTKSDEPAKIELGLGSVRNLWLKSSNFQKEELCEPLLRCILHLGNSYDISDFDKIRRDVMSLCMVSLPKVAITYLMSQFHTADLSLGQKLDIINSAILAVKDDRNPLSVSIDNFEKQVELFDVYEKHISVKASAKPMAYTLFWSIIRISPNADSKIFRRSHSSLLERVLLLFSFCINASTFNIELPQMIEAVLIFLSPIVSGKMFLVEANTIWNRTIFLESVRKMSLLPLSVCFSKFPESISPSRMLKFLEDIVLFLQDMKESPKLVENIRYNINVLFNPQRLIQLELEEMKLEPILK